MRRLRHMRNIGMREGARQATGINLTSNYNFIHEHNDPMNAHNDHPIDQDTINRAVWAACDTFRGTVDSSIYKDYVLTMLFLKYISDVWQDHYNGFQKAYGNNPALIEELLKNERFVLPPSANFYVLYSRRIEPGNGERIDDALRQIAESNDEKLHAVFQDIHFNSNKLGDDRQKDDILRQLLVDFAKPGLNLSPSRVGALDVIGNAYEFLIKNFASTSGKKAGEFYTPAEISQLMALLVDPKEGDQICDPTCGSGSLLMKCGQLIRQKSQSRIYALYGQEAIGSTWALAKMNMFLHGEDNHRIEWGDTLRSPKLLNPQGKLIQFDVVVANPPFSLEKWGDESVRDDGFQRFERGMPPKTKADYAFIQHMIATMKPGSGRMAVVVPTGVLFRGLKEGAIRQRLIEDNLLDAVISLPEKLFYGTGISGVILLFRHNKCDDTVLFINASRQFQDGKSQNLLREQDVLRILHTYQARCDVDQYAHLASGQEVADNHFNLNIARYVNTSDDEEVIDLSLLRQERDHLKRELDALEKRMDSWLEELGMHSASMQTVAS
jgi:type I restriction enzyme M protein